MPLNATNARIKKYLRKIILEVKVISQLNDQAVAQAINYLSVSRCKLALLVNFGEMMLNYKRIVR